MGKISEQNIQSKVGTPVLIRTATVTDATSILELAHSVFKTSEYLLTEPDEFKVTLEEEEKWIGAMEQAPFKLLLVAVMNDQLVGMLDFSNGHRKRISHTGMLGMSVKREYRGIGIGEMFIKALLGWAKSTGCLERIELEVFFENKPAISLYEKLGFVEEGRKVRSVKFSAGKYMDSVLMCYFPLNNDYCS